MLGQATLRLALGFALITFAACRRAETATPEGQDAGPEDSGVVRAPLDLPLIWSRLPLLPRSVRPRGWPEALNTWRTATTAYAAQRPREASKLFLGAAELLRGEEDPTAERVRTTGRCLAYENAGLTLRAAHDPAGAHALWAQLLEKDPACRSSLELRLSRLARDLAPAETSTSAE